MQTLFAIVAISGGLALTVSLTIFELRKTPKQEVEMIQRENEAMSKVPDDPHEPARWVP